MLEDAVRIAKAMFTQPQSTVQGTHFSTQDVYNVPQPVRAGGPPIMIGVSGEKKTIPMIAKYGDASNFFGDVETIRHKVSVIEQHCAEIGRDPSEITKTRLGTLLIGATERDADAKLGPYAMARGMSERRARAFATVGGPESVAEQAQAFLDAGLDGLLFNLPDVHDLEPVELAGHALAPVVV
jgi:alkanesulfonate monooxygenase SsuD/methylene tetrahydromethanopterin reductase-like flavin-dependent oxidoreductase (luciferase family)